ncbi:hypothetical protein DMB42_12260 [Nonomuraea sp. WAC 01424]|nr:hypothetical protein DMB42_12260 [Nonomuraea sp. WAC 01424]
MIAVCGYQAMVAGLTATVVDQFPPARRTRVAGVFSMCNIVGVVPAMVLAQVFKDSLVTAFAVCGALAVAAALVLWVVLPDRRRRGAGRPDHDRQHAAVRPARLPGRALVGQDRQGPAVRPVGDRDPGRHVAAQGGDRERGRRGARGRGLGGGDRRLLRGGPRHGDPGAARRARGRALPGRVRDGQAPAVGGGPGARAAAARRRERPVRTGPQLLPALPGLRDRDGGRGAPCRSSSRRTVARGSFFTTGGINGTVLPL